MRSRGPLADGSLLIVYLEIYVKRIDAVAFWSAERSPARPRWGGSRPGRRSRSRNPASRLTRCRGPVSRLRRPGGARVEQSLRFFAFCST